MSNKQMIRRLIIVNMLLSFVFIGLMFFFVSKGGSGKFSAQIMRMGYGAALFVVGLRLMQVLVGKRKLQELLASDSVSFQQNILDENVDDKVLHDENRREIRLDFIIACIYLLVALFLIIGELVLGFDYSVAMTVGFVYAVLLILLGLGQYPDTTRNS